MTERKPNSTAIKKEIDAGARFGPGEIDYCDIQIKGGERKQFYLLTNDIVKEAKEYRGLPSSFRRFTIYRFTEEEERHIIAYMDGYIVPMSAILFGNAECRKWFENEEQTPIFIDMINLAGAMLYGASGMSGEEVVKKRNAFWKYRNEDKARIEAGAILQKSDAVILIQNAFVDPEYRLQGYCRAMLHAVWKRYGRLSPAFISSRVLTDDSYKWCIGHTTARANCSDVERWARKNRPECIKESKQAGSAILSPEILSVWARFGGKLQPVPKGSPLEATMGYCVMQDKLFYKLRTLMIDRQEEHKASIVYVHGGSKKSPGIMVAVTDGDHPDGRRKRRTGTSAAGYPQNHEIAYAQS